MLKIRSQCDQPPGLVSDGWRGHGEALVEVYEQVPPYQGRGRPPTKKRPQPDWEAAGSKTLGFSKQLSMLEAACIWEDIVYNFNHPVKSLRQEVNDGYRR